MTSTQPRSTDPIGSLLRAARNAKRWSLTEMEKHTGVASIVIGSYERGDRAVSVAKARFLLEQLGHQLVVLGPATGGALNAGWLEHAVEYGPGDADRIICADADEARRIVARMPGSRAVSRWITAALWTPLTDGGQPDGR